MAQFGVGTRWLPLAVAAATAGAAPRHSHVLLILVDDLKPALGCYGDRAAVTPHMDSLAARGLRFDLAYCHQAVCAPSRFHLMLGAHSTSTGLYGLGQRLREVLPDAVTLPQHLAQYGGYRTESLGKVYHIGHGNEGDPSSFRVPPFDDKVIEYADPASTRGRRTREEALFENWTRGRVGELPRGPAWESPEVPDEAYADGRVAAEAVRRLEAAAERARREGTPFFIAVGFARPHLPFSVPRRYWERVDPAKLPRPPLRSLPRGAPAVAGKRGGEIANYEPIGEDGTVSEEVERTLIHGYYASVAYVDAQIGRLLAAVDGLGLASETIIVLWGDNGFHLGDHGLWTKHTNYEQATRVPLIVVAPGVTRPGRVTRQPAGAVDLLATLCELAGLPAPRGPQPRDGVSLLPVLRDPAARVRDHVLHVFPRGPVLGRAVRTERHRLVEWRRVEDPADRAEIELYDLMEDPEETVNLAPDRPELVRELGRILARYPDPRPPVGRPAPRIAMRPPDSPEEIARALRDHDRAVLIREGWIRDPYIVAGPDGWWYLTGTTFEPGDPLEHREPYNRGLFDESGVGWHVQVWRSRDLIAWETLGALYSLTDGVWSAAQPAAFAAAPRPTWRLWAPELHWTGDRWALVHTSPYPVRGSNLSLSEGAELRGPWQNPMGVEIGQRHDPSLFRDDDGVWWLVWGATEIAPIRPDWTGFAAAPVRIGPARDGVKMGHEGCLIRKIHGRYVLFGTGWSTGRMRKGSYNLYYAVADRITGPYGPRRLVGRFLGHGTPFQDREGRWWCTAFFNADVPPLPAEGIETRDLSETAQTINPHGVTIVPLEVRVLDDGDLLVRAKPSAYATAGPDEAALGQGKRANGPFWAPGH